MGTLTRTGTIPFKYMGSYGESTRSFPRTARAVSEENIRGLHAVGTKGSRTEGGLEARFSVRHKPASCIKISCGRPTPR